MYVFIDNAVPQKAQSGRRYISFWARVLIGTEFISIAGFKYFPDTKSVSTPTQGKGGGKFVNLTKMSGGLYNAIAQAAEKVLADYPLDAVDPEIETAKAA